MRYRRHTCVLGLLALAVLVLATAAAAARDGGPRSSLLASWRLNEHGSQRVADSSGNGHHGVRGDTRRRDEADPERFLEPRGERRLFLGFDGSGYVRVRDSDGLEPEHVTVEAWTRGDSSPGRFRYLVSKGADRCEAASFGLYTGRGGGLAFYVYDGASFMRSPELDASVWDGGWHHVAGTYDGGAVRLYVDGREVGSGTPASIDIAYELPHGGDLFLGTYLGTCPESLGFVGDLDHVRIWSRALSAERIARHAD